MRRHIIDRPNTLDGAMILKRFAQLERRRHVARAEAPLYRKPRHMNDLPRVRAFLRIARQA